MWARWRGQNRFHHYFAFAGNAKLLLDGEETPSILVVFFLAGNELSPW